MNVRLTWTESESGASLVNTYYVLRKLASEESFLQIGVLAVERDEFGGRITPLEFLDITAQQGLTYDYRVTAHPIQGQDVDSNEVEVDLTVSAPTGVTLYADWSAPVIINTSGHYTPGVDVISEGKPQPFMVVVGHCAGAIDPGMRYGGTTPVVVRGSSGVWMSIFDLTANPPANDLLVALNGQSAFSALVVYGVASYTANLNQAFPATPATDVISVIPAGSFLVGMGMSVHGASLSVLSSDGSPISQVTLPDGAPFNDGQAFGINQFPAASSVTFTWDSDGFTVRNLASAVFSGG